MPLAHAIQLSDTFAAKAALASPAFTGTPTAPTAAAAADAAAQAERDALAAQARQKIAEASGLTPEEMAALGF